jgi:hypothetical protein
MHQDVPFLLSHCDGKGHPGMPIPTIRFPTGPILRSIADLDVPNLEVEEIRHVSTAQVALADYTVIQADFPELRDDNLLKLNPWLESSKGVNRQRAIHGLIDDWLIANAAWVSAVQSEQAFVNTSIVTDKSAAVGYRPPGYGRSLVVPVQPVSWSEQTRERWPAIMTGLLDLKGAGVGPGKTPARSRNADGLEYLGVALKDYVVKRAVDAIFERELPTMWTVPIYAVLDLGFDVYEGPLGTAPAGMHVRRAHRRVLNESQWGQVYVSTSLEVERALRKYGLTSASRRARLFIEEINGRLSVSIGDSKKESFTPEEAGLCLQL